MRRYITKTKKSDPEIRKFFPNLRETHIFAQNYGWQYEDTGRDI